jgi:hypothetical protein
MNSNAIGYWNEKKQKLRKKYHFLTDNDLSYNEGKEQEMIEILSKKLGKTKQELLEMIVAL